MKSYLVKTREQLELEGCYFDFEGDAWIDCDAFKKWKSNPCEKNDTCIDSHDFGFLFAKGNGRIKYKIDNFKFGVERILTKEGDPEYFL